MYVQLLVIGNAKRTKLKAIGDAAIYSFIRLSDHTLPLLIWIQNYSRKLGIAHYKHFNCDTKWNKS